MWYETYTKRVRSGLRKNQLVSLNFIPLLLVVQRKFYTCYSNTWFVFSHKKNQHMPCFYIPFITLYRSFFIWKNYPQKKKNQKKNPVAQSLVTPLRVLLTTVFHEIVDFFVLDMCSKPIFCSKIALTGKTCSRLVKPQKVAPNAKSCSKVAEHNRDRPIRISLILQAIIQSFLYNDVSSYIFCVFWGWKIS